MKFRKEIILLFLGVLFASCSSSGGTTPIVSNPVVVDPFCATITYAKDIKPIMDSSCIQCHGNNGSSPNLSTYNGVKGSAYEVKSQVVSGNMPQGSTLTSNQIKAISCWVDAGAINN